MSYDLKAVKAPRLAGVGLRIFAGLLERALPRALILPKLLKDAGIAEFRADNPPEAPTLLPLVIPEDRILAEHPLPVERQAALVHELPRAAGAVPFATVRDYHEAYRKLSVTPTRVAERLIQAIADSNGGKQPLRSIIASHSDEMLKLAALSTARWRAGEPLGPFDGIPVAIKDELDQAGYPTTVGTAFLGQEPATADATPVHRLREQGALLIGKANMHEIGIAVTGNNPHHGVARNPYNLDHYTGGSSSGSGAAVAAGLCPVALGADGGGSIRIPAAFCGVYGLKPTFGRVSEHGAAPIDWSVAHVGPLAATVADLVLGYLAVAGPDELDPISQHQPPINIEEFREQGVRGLTFGIYEPWFRHAHPEIVAACDAQVRRFEKAGARIRKIELPRLNSLRVAHVVSIASEMAMAMEEYYDVHRTDFGCDVRINLALARSFTSRDYVRAQRIRTRAMADFAHAFYEVDAILTPTTGITAPRILPDALRYGESDLEKLTETMRFVVPSNMTGNPAISFPIGYDRAGLPIGMQAIGRHWQESRLFQIAFAAESELERRKPEAFFPILANILLT
jgi:Asp-tRNA(Asn)/Glu-tRNA(Gln) amidotransferase A subunit family amidase